MQHRPLGPTGLFVSEFALGRMTFGAESDEAMSWDLLDIYVAAGGCLIDTVDVYQARESERIVGRSLADRGVRDQVVIATKARFPLRADPGPNDHGLSATYLLRAVDASFERLGVDHIDPFQTHAWDPAMPVEDAFGALDAMVTAGKVRYLGVSNVTGLQLERMARTVRSSGPPGSRVWGRIPTGASRRTTGATPLVPGTSSRSSAKSPRTTA